MIEISLRLLRNLIDQKIIQTFELKNGILNNISDLELISRLARFTKDEDEILA